MKLTRSRSRRFIGWAHLEYDPEVIKSSGNIFDDAFRVDKEVRDATEVICGCGEIHNE